MKQKEFRQLQKTLDDLGFITAIIRSGKNKSRRYQVISNGELIKQYKHRISAKNRIVKLFNTKTNQTNG